MIALLILDFPCKKTRMDMWQESIGICDKNSYCIWGKNPLVYVIGIHIAYVTRIRMVYVTGIRMVYVIRIHIVYVAIVHRIIAI
mgnify:CR=1 FL=1